METEKVDYTLVFWQYGGMNEHDLLTLPQAASLRGVTKQAMLNAVKTNRLAAFRLGRWWLVNRQDVEALELKNDRKNSKPA